MYVCENDSIANAMKTRCNILIYEKISSNPKTGLKCLVSTVKFYIYYKIVCSFLIYIIGQKISFIINKVDLYNESLSYVFHLILYIFKPATKFTTKVNMLLLCFMFINILLIYITIIAFKFIIFNSINWPNVISRYITHNNFMLDSSL